MNNERDRAEAAEKAAELFGLQFNGSAMWVESGEKKRFDYWTERFEWGKAQAAAADFVHRLEKERAARDKNMANLPIGLKT